MKNPRDPVLEAAILKLRPNVHITWSGASHNLGNLLRTPPQVIATAAIRVATQRRATVYTATADIAPWTAEGIDRATKHCAKLIVAKLPKDKEE